jgi:hypothetical protein
LVLLRMWMVGGSLSLLAQAALPKRRLAFRWPALARKLLTAGWSKMA